MSRLPIYLLFSIALAACGGGSSDGAHDDGGNDSSSNSSGGTDSSGDTDSGAGDNGDATREADVDGDGIADTEDGWPNDPTHPVVSSLWGVNGELWSPGSRLPLVAFAGYHEGRDPLPDVARVVANVLEFGAIGDGVFNDTTAFHDAIAAASAEVSAQNPGVLLVPAGEYVVDDQLHLAASGLVLRGEGRDKTRIRFTRGLVGVGSGVIPGGDELRSKLLVMGGGYDDSGKLCTGVDWQQYNNAYSAPLDTAKLPKRGDFSLHLAAPLSAELKNNIVSQGYRIRLAQAVNYGEDTATPVFAANIYSGSNGDGSFVPNPAVGSGGAVWISQQFVVEIGDDDQTLFLDRPLRFSPTDETMYGGVRIAVRNNDSGCSTEEIGVEHLTIELPATDWLEHFGTEGQGGIDLLSDNSWVRDVRLINADNGIELSKHTFNNTLTGIRISSTRAPRRSGPAEHRFDTYGHHGITVRGRDQMARDFILDPGISYVHDATIVNCQGCVIMNGQADFMNMDHHRQGVYDSVWTEMQLGDSDRMWSSTGREMEGYNAAAFNTYWNIRSATPYNAYWPEDGEHYPQWGYHVINVVGTEILEKPGFSGDSRYPYPYDPTNAHLEVIDPSEVWPQNIYKAQVKAYREGRLFTVP